MLAAAAAPPAQAIRDHSKILMGKNTMMRRCIRLYCERTGNDQWLQLLDHMVGNVGLIFTKGDLNEVGARWVLGAGGRGWELPPCLTGAGSCCWAARPLASGCRLLAVGCSSVRAGGMRRCAAAAAAALEQQEGVQPPAGGRLPSPAGELEARRGEAAGRQAGAAPPLAAPPVRRAPTRLCRPRARAPSRAPTAPQVRKVIDEFKVGAPARVGLVAPNDVTIPAGNTGMDPSQTSFFQVRRRGRGGAGRGGVGWWAGEAGRACGRAVGVWWGWPPRGAAVAPEPPRRCPRRGGRRALRAQASRRCWMEA